MMRTERTRQFFQKKEKGQIIVIMALVFIGLIAVVGLAIDLGYLYVSYSRLRRAVDAAALSASSQFREGYTVAGLQNEAKQFLKLNGVAPEVSGDTLMVKIENCETTPGDPDLCTTPRRKLIRVTVTENVPLFFLSIIGIHSAPITVEALSEAASVDLVILIDASTSMALTNSGAEADPKGCNQGAPGDPDPGVDPGGAADDGDYAPGEVNLGRFPGECHPFEEIKKAAVLLTRRLYLAKDGNPGYDRISIVTYDRFPHVILEMSDQQTLVEDAIRNLRVYQGEGKCPWPYDTMDWWEWAPSSDLFEGPCRAYNFDTTFARMWAAGWNLPDGTYDPRARTVTNSGGGLKVAGNILGGAYPSGYPTPWPETRQAALWVVVWLTDGYTNSGFEYDGAVHPQTSANAGLPICPPTTWGPQGGYGEYRFCADLDARPTAAELAGSTPPSAASLAARHARGSANYDADDYARDMIDFVTDPVSGQGAMLFTVGLGNKVREELTNYERNFTPNPLPPPGETLLEYGAYKGNGVYYFAPNSDQLNEIFVAIANKIATRLSR